jgi:hypothetical protein
MEREVQPTGAGSATVEAGRADGGELAVTSEPHPITGISRTALGHQEGGSHYKDYPIQPVEFCQRNRLPYCESNIVKYVCRHARKNGLADLKKARLYLDLLIELEYGDQ